MISNIFIEKENLREGKLVMNVYKVFRSTLYEVDGKELDVCEILHSLLKAVLPIFIYLPLELEFLNSNKFSPVKNYE
jgi:hypothetical protein